MATSLNSTERRLLALLRLACSQTLEGPDLQAQLQRVKKALFEKDYLQAFESAANQQAYIARWVPSRALMYHNLLSDYVWPHLLELPDELICVCIGAGAPSELLALCSTADSRLQSVFLIDQADWSTSLQEIEQWVRKPIRDCGFDAKCKISFNQLDCLDPDAFQSVLDSIPAPSNKCFTIFFTIHELMLQARAKAINMLSQLSRAANPGDILTIIESANLSTVIINNKMYELGLLLDHLLTKGKEWKTLVCESSLWYRVPQDAKDAYPIPLENSRIFLRVYQKQ